MSLCKLITYHFIRNTYQITWWIQTAVLKHMTEMLPASHRSPKSSHHYDNFGLLTHWGRVMHICVSKLTIICSDNGLSPGRRQAIIWTNAGMLLIEPLGINFSEILIEIKTFSFKKMNLKMSSAKWRPFCLGLNVLIGCLWHHMADYGLLFHNSEPLYEFIVNLASVGSAVFTAGQFQ